MRSRTLLLALTLCITAIAFTVPREGNAGPPGKVAQYEKAVKTETISLESNYEFVGNVLLTEKVVAVPAKGIEVLKVKHEPTKKATRVVQKKENVPRLSKQVRLIQKIPPLMA